MSKSGQVTLRNVDTTLKQLIDQYARKRGVSINRFVLDIVKEAVGYTPTPSKRWREFAGAIPEEGLDSEVLADFEKIDDKMWR